MSLLFNIKYNQHSTTASHASETSIFSIYILAFNSLILYYITGMMLIIDIL